MKKVSIVIPIYNCEKYLRKSLDSVVNQTYKDLEIILINDGSTDNSLAICKEFKNSDSRIILIDKKNAGVSEARNDGIKKATGDYLIFIDSDDWLEYDTISICMDEIGNNDLLMFPYIREFSNKSIERKLYENEFELTDKNEIYNRIYLNYIGPYNTNINNPVELETKNAIWGKVYKTKIAKSISFIDFKTIMGEDLLFNITYVKKIKSLKYIEKTFYHYNKCNTSSLTKIDTDNLLKRWKKLYSYINEEISTDNYEKEINCLNNRIVLNLLTITQQIYNTKESLKTRIENLKSLLKDTYYVERFKNFKFDSLDLKWKAFYWSCKKRNIILLLILLNFINILKKRG